MERSIRKWVLWILFNNITFKYQASNSMLLRCKLFNARSLCNKLSNLHLLLHSYDFDIIFITESWLNGDLSDSLLLSGSSYYILRKIDMMDMVEFWFLFRIH